jgi:hypothetical protein
LDFISGLQGIEQQTIRYFKSSLVSVLLPPTVPGWLYWMRIVPWGSSTFVTMPLVIACCAKAAELRTVRAAAAAKKNMLFFISASGPKAPLGCAHRDDRGYFIAASYLSAT